MNRRELILLSPYRIPAKDSMMLADEDVAAFLNGYLALWHPVALYQAVDPPRIASPYDYENPVAGHVYAVPETPTMFLPEDWDRRVLDAGAVAFRSGTDRAQTLDNLRTALKELAERSQTPPESSEPPTEAAPPIPPALFDLDLEKAAPFFGIGFGFVHVNALFEAMDHDNLLPIPELWQEVQQAVEALLRNDTDACRSQLQAVADRLLAGREALYPVAIHVVDLGLLDEQRLEAPWPAALEKDQPFNVVACGAVLEKLNRDHPARLQSLRERVQSEQVEVCGGPYLEREDTLLPIESQLWNINRGRAVSRELLGKEVQVFARQKFGTEPQRPQVLAAAGLTRALTLSFDDSGSSTYRATVVSWPLPDGRQLDTFTRSPYRADSPQTFFHAAYYLHQTISQDHAATLALAHREVPAPPWYVDWMELNRFAPVLGKWTTLSNYFNEVMSGEQASLESFDEAHGDLLTARSEGHVPQPVSWFAEHARLRRRIDTIWSLAAIQRGLCGKNDPLRVSDRLSALENRAEQGKRPTAELLEIQQEVMGALASRLLARAGSDTPGYLVVNPCSFARRLALELDDIQGPLPIAGPIKACQIDAGKAKVVIEVPALGFAWFPRNGPPGTPPQTHRTRLADDAHVRNEFFEAEIDPNTGGLRGIWDQRSRISRLGQQLVFNPGSVMRAKSVKATSTGPALGEVVSEGAIFDEHDKVLATFRQRYRAWLGRPVLDLRIEIFPEETTAGYPWHAYYGARFAWRDERALLLRGVQGTGLITTQTRPETPDFLEWRLGRQNTVLFPGGLPFHQRHGTRMLDVILVAEGESCRTFDLGLALDRERPTQTAFGMITPVPLLAVAKGPPHVGAAGWLYHLDATNLLLTGMRPAAGDADAFRIRVLECDQQSIPAEFRCVRNPVRAARFDAQGESIQEMSVNGDALQLEVAAGDFMEVQVEFS